MNVSPLLAGLVLTLAGLAASPSAGQDVDLPEQVEVPDTKGPAMSPGGTPEAESTGQKQDEPPPLPAPRPDDASGARGTPGVDGSGKDEDSGKAAPDASPAQLPGEEVACRMRLRALGVVFEEHEPLSDPSGCSAPHPITVSGLPGDVALEPGAVMNCALAEATAKFVRDVATPMAKKEFSSPPKTINQASAYVCRPRNGQTKLSEHAFANALDWASFELADGTTIAVHHQRRSEPRRARFLAALREAACGPFKTVLGPGSDADHADHFHFDLAQRRNGGTFCQ